MSALHTHMQSHTHQEIPEAINYPILGGNMPLVYCLRVRFCVDDPNWI